MQLLHIAEGFQDQNVGATFQQSCDLLAKSIARLLERSLAQRLNADTQRTYGTCHPGIEALSGLLGKFGPSEVDFADLAGKPVPLQPQAVAAKGVGIDYFHSTLSTL